MASSFINSIILKIWSTWHPRWGQIQYGHVPVTSSLIGSCESHDLLSLQKIEPLELHKLLYNHFMSFGTPAAKHSWDILFRVALMCVNDDKLVLLGKLRRENDDCFQSALFLPDLTLKMYLVCFSEFSDVTQHSLGLNKTSSFRCNQFSFSVF